MLDIVEFVLAKNRHFQILIFFVFGRGGVRTQVPRFGGISYRPYDIASANISEKCLAISWFISIRSMVLDRCAVSDQRLSSFRWEHTILVSAKTIFIFSVFLGDARWGGGLNLGPLI